MAQRFTVDEDLRHFGTDGAWYQSDWTNLPIKRRSENIFQRRFFKESGLRGDLESSGNSSQVVKKSSETNVKLVASIMSPSLSFFVRHPLNNYLE